MLNGAPRSGKSSIVAAIQDSFDGVWVNLGVDVFVREVTPPALRPGIGLRPGDERPELRALLPRLYAAMYESIAAHSRLGFNVVVDVGHYDESILVDCARRLEELPAWFVGVRCPIEVVMQRRDAGQQGRKGRYASSSADDPVPDPVRRWQEAVHVPGIYDLEVDTSLLSPAECATEIRELLAGDVSASVFREIAERS